VVIVGAGLAGLSAAYRLWTRHGIQADIYEARTRLGGRVLTQRGLPGEQWFESGPMFISSSDRAIRELAHELDVPLVDILAHAPEQPAIVYHFNGSNYSAADLERAYERTARNAQKQFSRLMQHATYKHKHYWDSKSVAEWIDSYCPGGLASAPGASLKNYFESEYSAPAELASALMIIFDFTIFSDFDERYIVDGGTDTIVSALVSRLPPRTVATGMALTALTPGDESVICRFTDGVTTNEVSADFVILALPFSTLRDVDYSSMGFDSTTIHAIQTKGMGTGSKLNLQFDYPPWDPLTEGQSYSDLPPQGTFAGQIGLPGPNGIMAELTTFDFGDTPAHGPAPATLVSEHLAYLDQLFPGTSTKFNGQAYLDQWPVDPWVKGSYSYYKVGQFTTIAGIENQAQGRVHFAGEHTARYHDQATMDGAVESGERAANEVARAVRDFRLRSVSIRGRERSYFFRLSKI
jgi:monoamine oxidase